MMMFRKSMISVAAAAAMMAGFTGCSEDTNNYSTSTSTTVNENEQASYAAPIQGLVIDDSGNPVVGAKVTIGNQTTETNSGGQYVFESVDISSYVLAQLGTGNHGGDHGGQGHDGCEESCLLVSIEAPEGSDMNNVVVGVEPEMVHISDATDDYRTGGYSEEFVEVDVTGNQNVLANSQSFVLNSQVGTAMLTHKAANVKVYIGNENTGAALPEGTKVLAVYNGVDVDNFSGVPGSVNSNYITGVNTVVAYVDANGMVEFNNILTSASYELLVEGYTFTQYQQVNTDDTTDYGEVVDANRPQSYSFNTSTYQGYASSEYVNNLGNLMVIPIINGDEVNPLVATVLNQYGMYGMGDPGRDNLGVLMLQRTVTNTIEIMFTETVVGDDIEENVKVVSVNSDGQNVAFLDATASLSGNKLTVTLAEDLTDGQRFRVLLFRDSNIRDLAGNPLYFRDVRGPEATDEGTYSPWIAASSGSCADGVCEDASLRYLSCDVNGRAFVFDFMGYKELMLDAEGATVDAATQGQMELDTDVVRTVDSVVSLLETNSNAFNSVDADDPDTDLYVGQLNAAEAETRLENLANVLLGVDNFDLDTDMARVRFTANNALAYEINVLDKDGCTVTLDPDAEAIVSQASCTAGVNTDDSTGHFMINGFTPGAEIDLLIEGVEPGDTVVITPVNELCMYGTAAQIPLVDNVAPTTVLQNSYIGGSQYGGEDTRNPAFGDGGELVAGATGDIDLGTPALYITPGLLDNMANGNHITVEREGDETLEDELYAYNHEDSNFTWSDEDVYDATAFLEFANNLERDIAVSFSESLQPGATATYTGTSNYRVINDVLTDDIGTFGTGGTGTTNEVYTRDLVAFTAADVLTLANVDAGSDMVFTNTLDLAGNTAVDAKVRILDGMPPMVTKAMFDGEKVVITFTENIVLDEDSRVRIEGPTETDTLYYAGNEDDWTVVGNELTIMTSALSAGNFDDNYQYDESAIYGLDAGDYPHGVLDTDYIRDEAGNSWRTWRANDRDYGSEEIDSEDTSNPGSNENDLYTPEFAIISAIGDFEVSIDNDFVATPDSGVYQRIVWTFNQPIRTGEGEYFANCGETLNDDDNGSHLEDLFSYQDWMTGNEDLLDELSDVNMTLNGSCTEIELEFIASAPVCNEDYLRDEGNWWFTSVLREAAYQLGSQQTEDVTPDPCEIN